MAVVGDAEAGRAQAVAIERGTDLPAIGKGDCRRAVPRLHQRGMIFVKGSAVGVHQRIAGPGFGDQHHHRVGQGIAAGDQQLERIVEAGGIGLAVRNQRPHLVEIGAQQVGLHRPAPGVHPVDIATHRVDLAIVGDKPVGMRQFPRGEGIGREALVDHGHGRGGQRVVQVLVEGSHLVGEQQPLVDNGPGRKRRHVEFGQAGHVLFFRDPVERIVHLLADRQDLAFEGILIGQIVALADDRLANQRHLCEHCLADAGGVDRHVAPADHVLAFLGDETLEMGRGKFRFRRIGREEAHCDCIVAHRRQDEVFRLRPVSQQCVGNLQ